MAELIVYNKDNIAVYPDVTSDQIIENISEDSTRLIIASLDESDFINRICTYHEIHQLLVEDIYTTTHLPKFEQFENYYFLVMKYLEFGTGEDIFQTRQISLILKDNNVLVFLEGKKNPALEEIRRRLNESIGNLRTQKSDYLFYRIIDFSVDQYFSALNYIRVKVDDLEDLTVEGETANINHEIIEIKRHINQLRRISVPLREEIIRIKNIGPGLIRKHVLTYFQDILDHLTNTIASLENFRDILTDLMELHFSQMSATMNQVMKTLTVVTAVFIPLTFIVGIYGMNFRFMPELEWKYGYLAAWFLIFLVALIMLYYMRRKKWL